VGGYTWSSTNVGTTVTWPAGFHHRDRSKGVADAVVATDGAIGYVSPDYTQQVATPQTSPAPVTANLQTRASFDAGQTATVVKPIPPAPTYTQNAVNAITLDGQLGGGLERGARQHRHAQPVEPDRRTSPEAYPISGYTMLDLYTCYFPAAETRR